MVQIDIVCLGELLIDMFPGETGKRLHEVEAFYPKPGGAPANVAVAASRLGTKCAFVGKVGKDHFGKYLANLLKDEGVNTDGLLFDPQVRTTMAIIAQPTIEEAEFVFYRNPGADQTLTSKELNISILRSARILHFGSVSLTDEPIRTTTLDAIQAAKGAGALISCDVNYRPALWKDAEQALAEIERVLPMVNLLKVNENEAALLSGIECVNADRLNKLKAAATAMLSKGPDLVVISLGSAGSFFQTREGSGEIVRSFKVESVDSVGCGDAFIAGLLSRIAAQAEIGGYLEREFLKEAVTFANAVGAITSKTKGAIPAMPRMSEVQEFLSRQDRESL